MKRKIKIGSAGKESSFKKSDSYAIVLENNTKVKGGGFSSSPLIGSSEKDGTYKIVGYDEDFVKVLINDTTGWFEKDKILFAELNGKNSEINKFKESYYTPPKINILNTPLITQNGEIILSGSVSDNDRIENISVFNGEDKVELLTPDSSSQSFSFKVKLESGINVFNIIAKDSTGLYSKETVTVRRADIS